MWNDNKVLKEEVNDEEEYYLLRRRLDNYVDTKNKEKPYNEILNLLNNVLDTKYKSLLKIQNINIKDIPSRKKFSKILKNHIKTEDDFNMIYDKKTPVYIIINNILNKIDYSFICKRIDNESCFSVKPYKTSYIT